MSSVISHGLNFYDEWSNANDVLKELHENIPSSQSIDLIASEDESEDDADNEKNLLIIKSKAKSRLHDNSSNVKSSRFTRIEREELPKSPILKPRHAKPFSASVKNPNSDFIKKYCTNYSASKHIFNDKSIDHTTDFSSLSPILKTRFSKSCEKKYNSRSNLLDHLTRDFQIQSNKNNNNDNNNFVINSVSSQDTANNEHDLSSPVFRSNKIAHPFNTFGKSSLFGERPEESKVVISSCPSPVPDNYGQDFLSTCPSINTEGSNEDDKSCISRENLKRGSDWVKDILEITPEKCDKSNLDVPCIIKEEIDSTRKKKRKNGFAQRLQRLISFWQSNVNMWNHQMSLVAANSDISLSCSLSPGLNEDYPLKKSMYINSLSQSSPGDGGITKANIKTRFSKRSLCSLFFKENKPHNEIRLKQICNKSSVSCIRNLRASLEAINSSSSSSDSTPQQNFSIPRKHLCAEVIHVEWKTSVMISAICREFDDCSRGIDNAVCKISSNVYCIVFGRTNHREITSGNTVKIFAPWQVLEMENSTQDVIFASYYVITNREILKEKETVKKANLLTKIAAWECSCTRGSHVIPQMCVGGCLHTFTSEIQNTSLVSKCVTRTESTFNSIKDSSLNNSPKVNRFWTILEAIEQCGGLPDIPVSLTLRIRRIFTLRNVCNKEIANYLIIGQDPSGTFAILEIPNRPLKSTLEPLIENGLNTTHTLTHLCVRQRIISSQDPELFSLIHSLQEAYNETIINKPQIFSILKDETKFLQSFCYKFVVNLGQTVDYKITESDAINVVLPEWTLTEASVQKSGRRGNISVNILYYVTPSMYVQCRMEEKCEIKRLIVTNSDSFPKWVNCDGTIMVSANIEDVLISRSGIIIDKFSRIRKRKTEKVEIYMNDIFNLVPSLKLSSKVYDIVTVQGFIRKINTDKALVWEECNICHNSELHFITKNNRKCRKCLTENISVVLRYAMEVEIDTRCVDNEKIIIIVQLFQTTIKSFLKRVSVFENQYKEEDVLNVDIGPMVCYIKALEKSEIIKFLLLELPY